jgi:hypothetical protein
VGGTFKAPREVQDSKFRSCPFCASLRPVDCRLLSPRLHSPEVPRSLSPTSNTNFNLFRAVTLNQKSPQIHEFTASRHPFAIEATYRDHLLTDNSPFSPRRPAPWPPPCPVTSARLHPRLDCASDLRKAVLYATASDCIPDRPSAFEDPVCEAFES